MAPKGNGKTAVKEDFGDKYEIEAIRDEREANGVTQYCVKWMNYPDSENTWEPVENLTSCPTKLEQWKAEQAAKTKQAKDEAWEIEAIRKEMISKGGVQNYFVKWVGYPESDNTWEPEANLTGCPALLKKWKVSQLKPKPPKVAASASKGKPIAGPRSAYLKQNGDKKRRSPSPVDSDEDLPLGIPPWRNHAKNGGDDADSADGSPPAAKWSRRDGTKVVVTPKKPKSKPVRAGEDSDEEEPQTKTIEKKYAVEEIIGAHLKKGKMSFLIKWEDHPEDDSSWQPASGVKEAVNAVNDFYAKYGKPTAKNAKILSDMGHRFEEREAD